MRLAFLAAALVTAQTGHADISVRFIEGAPTDRFVISSDSPCATGPASITLDLSGSAGALIFDVTSAGQGVEVFQPLSLVSGADHVRQISQITDGGTALSLDLNTLTAGTDVAFTLDLDDTIGAREITVSGAEIAGATVSLRASGTTQTAAFDTSATATLKTPACTS